MYFMLGDFYFENLNELRLIVRTKQTNKYV